MPGSRRMRRSIQSTCRSFSIVAGLALTQQLVLAYPAIAQVSTVEERAAVAELMTGYHGEPGAVIAVVRGGHVAFAEGFGLANLEHSIPLGRETVLDIGSVAKQFTAFAIALLADEGTLSIDDDIRIHLPEVPDFGEVITIRHMIHHMSGLREIYTSEGIAGRQNGDAVQQADALRLTEHMHELNFRPGERYLYCNTAYMMLADIVSRASGVSFPEFMAERVFGPLGMHHTTIMSKLGQSIPRVAESYAPDDEGFVRVFDAYQMDPAAVSMRSDCVPLERALTDQRKALTLIIDGAAKSAPPLAPRPPPWPP